MKLLGLLLLTFAMMLGTHARALPMPAISITGPNVTSTISAYTFGYEFTADANLQVTALGVFDDFGDGLDVAYEVGVWNSSAVLLDSVVVPAGTSANPISGFRYQDLSTAIPLTNGASYRIGVLVPANQELVNAAASVVTNSITINTPDLFTFGTTLSRPTTVSGTTGRKYLTANMLLVPEPSAVLLVGSGLLALAGAARRRNPAR
jgi:hypothetical protein